MIAVGIGVALVFTGCPHDVHVDPPPHPDIHPPEPPRFKPTPPPRPAEAALGDAGQRAAHDGEADATEREIICFAYAEFYEPATGEVSLPSTDAFVNDVFERIRPQSEEEQLADKAQLAYARVEDLANGEFVALAESLACG
jgi:hypothetical protein